MEQVGFFVALVASFLFGGAVVWLLQRRESDRQPASAAPTELGEALHPFQNALESVEKRLAELQAARDASSDEIRRLSEELRAARETSQASYESLLLFGERFAGFGKNLELALESHGEAATYFESKVIAAAKRTHRATSTAGPSTCDLTRLSEALGEKSAEPTPAYK